MEVHHHSHTLRKKWTHYFWEFLMLFLAVFCGFLAEYQLEHKIEKDREEVYIKNLLEDLKSDTAVYQSYAKDKVSALGIIDSLMYLLKSTERQNRVGHIYFLARTLTMRPDMLFPNERTYHQMESSGQLRLIKKQTVSDHVSDYYHSLKEIQAQNERIRDRGADYFHTISKLFNAEFMLKIYKERSEPESADIKLLTTDPALINEFLISAQYLYGTYVFAKDFGLQRCKKAEDLIGIIKKEYHLE